MRVLSIVTPAALCALVLSGCGGTEGEETTDLCTKAAPIAVATLKMDEEGGGCTAGQDGYLLGSLERSIYLDAIVRSASPGCGSIVAYEWEVVASPDPAGFSLVGSDTQRPTFKASVPGEYTIQLTVTDSAGVASTQDAGSRIMFRFTN